MVRAARDPLTDPWSPSLAVSVMTRRQALGLRAGLRLAPGPGAEQIPARYLASLRDGCPDQEGKVLIQHRCWKDPERDTWSPTWRLPFPRVAPQTVQSQHLLPVAESPQPLNFQRAPLCLSADSQVSGCPAPAAMDDVLRMRCAEQNPAALQNVLCPARRQRAPRASRTRSAQDLRSRQAGPPGACGLGLSGWHPAHPVTLHPDTCLHAGRFPSTLSLPSICLSKPAGSSRSSNVLSLPCSSRDQL